MAAHAAAELAAQIAREGERHLVDAELAGFVVILDFDAVVGMDAAAVRSIQVIVAKTIVIGDDVHPGKRSVFNLPSEALPRIGRRVGLPSVDDPRLNLQMVRGENLYSHALEKPGRVGGNVGGLVGPVIEVVVAEQTDVGHEDSRIDVDSVHSLMWYPP